MFIIRKLDVGKFRSQNRLFRWVGQVNPITIAIFSNSKCDAIMMPKIGLKWAIRSFISIATNPSQVCPSLIATTGYGIPTYLGTYLPTYYLPSYLLPTYNLLAFDSVMLEQYGKSLDDFCMFLKETVPLKLTADVTAVGYFRRVRRLQSRKKSIK